MSLKAKGDRYWGLCPFHNEKTPSFSVTREKNIYYCFGCHKGGDVFNFLMELEKMSFVDAVKEAGWRCGVEVPTGPAENPEVAGFRSALKELYTRVSASFHHILRNSPGAARAREVAAATLADAYAALGFVMGR